MSSNYYSNHREERILYQKLYYQQNKSKILSKMALKRNPKPKLNKTTLTSKKCNNDCLNCIFEDCIL